MSFICVDFFGARQMADEIAAMGKDCAAMADNVGVQELTKLAGDLQAIAEDLRRATDEREAEDTKTLSEMSPNYGEVLQ